MQVEKVKNKPQWKVTLERKVVGHINFDPQTSKFQYAPKGSTARGLKYDSLNKCIDSLKDEA